MISLPQWDAAVWVNIATSVSVAVCFIIFLVFGWIRRGRLNVVQDGERWSITAVIVAIVAFFVGRGVQIAVAGHTVAQPWFLAIGVALVVACVACTVIVCRNHDEYDVFPPKPYRPGIDPERRSGVERRKDSTS